MLISVILDHARHPVCVYWVKSYLPAHHHRCLSHTPPAGTAQTHCVSNSVALHTAGCVAVTGQLVRNSSLTTARRAGHPGVRAGKRRGKPRRPPHPRRPPQAGRTTAPLPAPNLSLPNTPSSALPSAPHSIVIFWRYPSLPSPSAWPAPPPPMPLVATHFSLPSTSLAGAIHRACPSSFAPLDVRYRLGA